ncbi:MULTISPECIES: hypothetical protein [Frankia]|uniref:Uncharacterized protein n=1 Tax=Frankia alni (strain DSM 45986 / CECT 9034 / ACN14a) TaxID=326424 RepID=Q0RT52_FRAAA|nr:MULTISPECIES: hypothetical protein [Frankia]CAJ59250.1 hypothetical protein; putative membrane protein [Frankia alni ACN14a]
MNAPTTGAAVTTGAAGATGAGGARAAGTPRRVAARVGLGVVIGTYLGDALSAFFPGTPGYPVVAAGSLLGLLLGLLTAHRRELASASLGLAAGAVTGLVANPVAPVAIARTYRNAGTADYGYQPVVTLVFLAALGAALGQVVERRPRFTKPVSGLALGALGGHFAGLAAKTGAGRFVADSAGPRLDHLDGAGHADTLVSGYGYAHGYASAVFVAGGAVLGLLVGLVADRRRGLARPTLGLALGALLGGLGVAASRSMYAAFTSPTLIDGLGSDPVGRFAGVGYLGDLDPGHGLALVAGGAALGLLLGLLAERWHRIATPLLGAAVGGVVGHVAGGGLRLVDSTSFDWPDSLTWSGGSEPAGPAQSLVVGHGNGQVVALLIGAVLGGVAGPLAGPLAGRRRRLLTPLAGLVLAVSAVSAVSVGYDNFVLLASAPSPPSNDALGVRIAVLALACLVAGLGAGVIAGRCPRLVRPTLGLVFGAIVGQTAADVAADAYLFAVDYTYNHPSDTRWAGVVGLLAGAAAGLVLGAIANRRPRLAGPSLGLALGALAGSAAGSAYASSLFEENRHPPDALSVYVCTAMVAGAVFGLLAGLTTRWPRRRRRVLGALAGVFSGAPLSALVFEISPAVLLVLSGAVGAVVAAGGLGASSAPSAGSTPFRSSSLPTRRVVRLLRPGMFAHGLVGLAAAIAASDGQQERYAEEFEATLVDVDGRLRRTRRLWCALTILAGAALLRAELARKEAERRS